MEISSVNRFYGHAHIIKEYCNYPIDEPLPLAIQHGAGRYVRQLDHEHHEEALFDYWVYSEWFRDNAIRVFDISKASLHMLGAPFAYLVKHLNYTTPSLDQRNGTIAFPDHSAPGNEIIGKYEEYAKSLASLSKEFHPITVSVHPHDIKLGKHITFIDHGLEVVTCGNSSPLQANFLHNFVHFCRNKKYVTANSFASACTYAMYLGLQLFFYGQPSCYNTTSKKEATNTTEQDLKNHEEIMKKFSLEALNDPQNSVEQLDFARSNLGFSHLLSPEELFAYLWDIRSTRKYINVIKPLFAHISKQFEPALLPSGPMTPLCKSSAQLSNSQESLDDLTSFLSLEIEYGNTVQERIALEEVTAVCVSSVELSDCVRALYRSNLHFKFSKILLFTSVEIPNDNLEFFPELEVVSIPVISSTQGYSQFILSELPQYVKTGFCLILQNDGYILNEKQWNSDFLNYDYIGAPWPSALPLVGRDGKPTQALNLAQTRVGNGGFSLRSKKLMDLASLLDLSNLQLPTQSEDLIICHFYNEWFQSQGIKYAPLEVAAKFSHECPIPEIRTNLKETFGFHGKPHIDQAHLIWDEKLKANS